MTSEQQDSLATFETITELVFRALETEVGDVPEELKPETSRLLGEAFRLTAKGLRLPEDQQASYLPPHLPL